MADLRRASVSLSARELEILFIAAAIGRMSLDADAELSLARSRDLDRAISKIADAGRRIGADVQ